MLYVLKIQHGAVVEVEQLLDVISHNKYANNYDYNKAIYMVNRKTSPITDSFFLRESSQTASPVACFALPEVCRRDVLLNGNHRQV